MHKQSSKIICECIWQSSEQLLRIMKIICECAFAKSIDNSHQTKVFCKASDESHQTKVFANVFEIHCKCIWRSLDESHRQVSDESHQQVSDKNHQKSFANALTEVFAKSIWNLQTKIFWNSFARFTDVYIMQHWIVRNSWSLIKSQ